MVNPGTIAGRFEVEVLAGRGGMGAVYRARDRETGGVAALKILHEEAPPDHAERLVREARLLAELTHPGFTRYLGFGTTERGRPYLAMEWLDGEDLSARLRREGIGASESVRMIARVAAALGVAHARGIIHRDIKPSNLFLVDKDPDRVKVLDFGIARVEAANDAMTRTGAAIGTPRYMAPEQARGARDIDARADVFSLGCVLYECLVGAPPFSGSSAAAIFAKILLEDAPNVGAARPDLPAALAQLVGRMLAKQPVDRPRDGAAVAAELDAIGDLGDTHRRARASRDSAITVGEQRLVCVVFAAGALGKRDDAIDISGAVPTAVDAPQTDTMQDVMATYTIDPRPKPAEIVRGLAAIVAQHRGRGEILADGSIVVTLLGQGAATDQAARGARCALAICELVPWAPMALSIARSVVTERVPVGELIEVATRLVQDAPPGIRVDQVSAGLLDVKFAIETDSSGLVLARERDVATAARTLLGKPIPCVGRERELAMLRAIFDECVAEPMAHVVLVTGAVGVGKSRLRFELLQRLGQVIGVETWIGRGDPMSAGAPFAMLAQALRRAAGIVDDEPLPVRQRKVATLVRRSVHGEDTPRVIEFLGELIGSPPDEPSVQLRAARRDPQLMGDQMLRACEDFVAAECAAGPRVLVLEDLQWGDLPTVQFVDAIVRRVADRALFVLALARPDVDAVFPRLWAERGIERVNLGELTRRAAEKLVREALGDNIDADTLARIVDRAAGNAFYLEELIRSVAEGHGDRLPETVVAMAQARIEGLEPEARHVLRAASVFGQVFWRGGVAALLQGSATQVHDWLDELVRRELVTARRDSRFSGEQEYVFRHALVREAAYAMLPERDRTVGHKLAGEWLAARVSPEAADLEAVALAEHFLRGGDPRRAIGWYRHAAEQALEGHDLANAIERAERAIACVHAVGDTGSAADNEQVGALRQLQADAHVWQGEYALAADRGAEALARLRPGTLPWLLAAAACADASTRRLEHGKVLELCRALADTAPAPGTDAAYAHAVAMTMTTLLWHGDEPLIERLFAQLDRVEHEVGAVDPVALAWVCSARAWAALRHGDPAGSLAMDQRCEQCFTIVGDLRHACRQHANVGYGELMLGAFDRAEASLREAIAIATRMGLHQVSSQAQHNLGLALARQGKLDEGLRVETAALAAFEAQGNRRLAAAAMHYLALIELGAGNHAAAIAHARDAIAAASDKLALLSVYRGTLAWALRHAGDIPAALAEATQAMRLMEAHGRPEEGEALARLAYAEALHASGQVDEARRVIADAAQRLHDAAAMISDPELRRSFLENVPEHAHTFEHARAWA